MCLFAMKVTTVFRILLGSFVIPWVQACVHVCVCVCVCVCALACAKQLVLLSWVNITRIFKKIVPFRPYD